jgi:hypothetical protein
MPSSVLDPSRRLHLRNLASASSQRRVTRFGRYICLGISRLGLPPSSTIAFLGQLSVRDAQHPYPHLLLWQLLHPAPQIAFHPNPIDVHSMTASRRNMNAEKLKHDLHD